MNSMVQAVDNSDAPFEDPRIQVINPPARTQRRMSPTLTASLVLEWRFDEVRHEQAPDHPYMLY